MRLAPVLAALVLIGGGLAWMLAAEKQRPEDPAPLRRETPEDPAPSPLGTVGTPPAADEDTSVRLVGRPSVRQAEEPQAEHREAVEKAREELARLRVLHESGFVSGQDLWRAELDLLDAGYALGAVGRDEYHRERARLFAGELRQLERLFEAGAVSEAVVHRARLHVLLEEAQSERRPGPYAEARAVHRETLERRFDALIESGFTSEQARIEALREFDAAIPSAASLLD